MIVTESWIPGATAAGLDEVVVSVQFAAESQLPGVGPDQTYWSAVVVPAGGVDVSPPPPTEISVAPLVSAVAENVSPE